MDGWAAVVTSDRCSPSLITRSALFLQRYRRRKCCSITVCPEAILFLGTTADGVCVTVVHVHASSRQ